MRLELELTRLHGVFTAWAGHPQRDPSRRHRRLAPGDRQTQFFDHSIAVARHQDFRVRPARMDPMQVPEARRG
jgi:hypothetical protein